MDNGQRPITAFFSRAKQKGKAPLTKRKRSLVLQDDDSTRDTTSAKRSKSDTPKAKTKSSTSKVNALATSGLSNSRARPRPSIDPAFGSSFSQLSPDTKGEKRKSQHARSTASSSSSKSIPPRDSTKLGSTLIDLTDSDLVERVRSESPLTPLPDGYDSEPLTPPRSPLFIASSQSQYFAGGDTPKRPFRRHPTQDSEILESSQSQDHFMTWRHNPPFVRSPSKLRRTSDESVPLGTLSNSSSFSQELPVRNLNLTDSDEHLGLRDTPEPIVLVPETQAWSDAEMPSPNNIEQLGWTGVNPSHTTQSSALIENDLPQPQSPNPTRYNVSPTPSLRSYSTNGNSIADVHSSSVSRSPSQPLSDRPRLTSPTIEATQDSMLACPPELAEAGEMWDDGSYPPDFPMSLRI